MDLKPIPVSSCITGTPNPNLALAAASYTAASTTAVNNATGIATLAPGSISLSAMTAFFDGTNYCMVGFISYTYFG